MENYEDLRVRIPYGGMKRICAEVGCSMQVLYNKLSGKTKMDIRTLKAIKQLIRNEERKRQKMEQLKTEINGIHFE